jgi:hypothetical protein
MRLFVILLALLGPLALPAAQIYPNPLNPDKGETLHIADVKNGDRMAIYNVAGESVYAATLSGNPSLDFWDCLNSNGVQVVTGVYFVVISGSPEVYRVAVVRDKR